MNGVDTPSYIERSESLRVILEHSVELDPERAADVRVLIDAGELGVAFEILCDNLDELNAPISASDRKIINSLAPGFHAEKYARYLDDNPVRPPEA